METRLAKIISILFQPLLIPTYALLIIFNLNSYVSLLIPYDVKRLIMFMMVITTFLFPVVFIFILYRRKIIHSLEMDIRNERILPMLITGIFYFLAYNMIRKLQLNEIYLKLFLGSFLSSLLALIVSLKWKISVHMMGVGGLAGALISLSLGLYIDLFNLIVIVLLIAGLTGFARLKLQAHKPLQVYTGFLAGFMVMLLVYLI